MEGFLDLCHIVHSQATSDEIVLFNLFVRQELPVKGLTTTSNRSIKEKIIRLALDLRLTIRNLNSSNNWH